MPNLGDYLGQLLSEISLARAQADLETVRLAEVYAAHPLLRTMPVPHVRLPEVELEIPVLVQAAEEPRAGETTRGGVQLAAVSEKFGELLDQHVAGASISLSEEERQRVAAAVDERLSVQALPAEASVDVGRLADDFTATALRTIEELKGPSETGEPAVPPDLAAQLREAVRLEFLKLRTPPPRLTVLVTSAEIREAATSENVTRIRLKVSEQALEWTTVDSETGGRDFLVPE